MLEFINNKIEETESLDYRNSLTNQFKSYEIALIVIKSELILLNQIKIKILTGVNF